MKNLRVSASFLTIFSLLSAAPAQTSYWQATGDHADNGKAPVAAQRNSPPRPCASQRGPGGNPLCEYTQRRYGPVLPPRIGYPSGGYPGRGYSGMWEEPDAGHVVIGALIGGGLFAGLCAAAASSQRSGDVGNGALVGGLFGALIGGIIGAVHTSGSSGTGYHNPPRPRRSYRRSWRHEDDLGFNPKSRTAEQTASAHSSALAPSAKAESVTPDAP